MSPERVLLQVVFALLIGATCRAGPFRQHTLKHPLKWDPRLKDDPGKPLFLTPYIQTGDIEEARALSEVKGVGEFPSYSGFFTVNEIYGSNMFFWFFPAQNGNKSAPLLLWLQGGPGASSLFGLFAENGPLAVDKSGNLLQRKVTWNSDYHMVYIDNPVGTGFSFTQKDSGYATNETEVGENLYNAMVQFFTVYVEYQTVDFYITGESYAGKYIPALGYTIHKANRDPQRNMTINLKGVLIGDGLVDPINMVGVYSHLLFQMGLLDTNEANYFSAQTDKAIDYIREGQYLQAFEVFDYLLNGDLYPYPSYFRNVTGCSNYDNMLRCTSPEELDYYSAFLLKNGTRRAIHVGNLTYNDGTEVEKHLLNDVMQSVADWLAILMDNYKVLLYNGQLDIIVGVPLTEAYLQVLSWSDHDQYLNTTKTVWRISPSDVEAAGYARTVGDFVQLVVRGSGHLVPYDQPERALDMVRRFISGKGF